MKTDNLFLNKALASLLGIILLTLVLVRAGSMLGCGVFRNKSLNLWFQTLTGIAPVALAIFLYSMCSWIAAPDSVADSAFGDIGINRVHVWMVKVSLPISYLWLFILPSVFALAFSFATIDKESIPNRPIAGQRARFLSFSLVTTFALLLLLTSDSLYREQKWLTPIDQETVISITLSSNNKILAATDGSGGVKLWSLPDKIGYPVNAGDNTGAMTATISPSGSLIAIGSEDGSVRLWNINTAKCFSTHNHPTDNNICRPLPKPGKWESAITSLSFTSDEKILAAGSKDDGIALWDMGEMRLLENKHLSIPNVECIGFTPQGYRLFVWDGNLARHWEINSDQPPTTLFQIEDKADHYAVTPDYKVLAIAFRPNELAVWDTEHKSILLATDNSRMLYTHFSSANQAQPDRGVQSDSPVVSLSPDINISSIALSPDGRLLAIGQGNGSISIYSVQDRSRLANLRGHKSGPTSSVFSSRAEFLLTSGKDNTIRFWDSRMWKSPKKTEETREIERMPIPRLSSLASQVTNQVELLRSNYAAAVGLWMNSDGTVESIGSRRTSPTESQLYDTLTFLLTSARSLAAPLTDPYTRQRASQQLRADTQTAQRMWQRVKATGAISQDLDNQWLNTLSNLRTLSNAAIR